eukprot:TRINITY_DN2518_c0_g1_i3.p1 TRINITY_DN2518_c0_g1~~TRINITY_DN2518_c0_g1_i3.p1  ORF type:complete len:329 (-),score=79.64 TRINITY_DN2518_c0_g1_i3:102-1088(-)
MCIRDRYQRRVRGVTKLSMVRVLLSLLIAALAASSYLPLRGIDESRAHGMSSGFDTSSGTLDNDYLDEWGSSSEVVDNRRYTWMEDQPWVKSNAVYTQGAPRDSYNNRLSFLEGNIAFSPSANANPGASQTSASQSSTAAGSPAAAVAVDGNTDSWWDSGTCMHTARGTDPWWRVDLGEARTVTHVQLFNLGGHPKYRMDELIVQVGSGASTDPRCGQRRVVDSNGNVHLHDESFQVQAGGTVRVSCASHGAHGAKQPGVLGSVVTVTHKGANKVLHLCEVQVAGSTQLTPARPSDVHVDAQPVGPAADPCSADLMLRSSGITRLCHD